MFNVDSRTTDLGNDGFLAVFTVNNEKLLSFYKIQNLAGRK